MADAVRHTERLVKEVEMHAEEKKGFAEVLGCMEKEKAEREAELGKAKRDYEEVVRESEDRIIAKDAHIIQLEKDLKEAYAEVAIQKVRTDEQAALAAQTKLDAEGAQERGVLKGLHRPRHPTRNASTKPSPSSRMMFSLRPGGWQWTSCPSPPRTLGEQTSPCRQSNRLKGKERRRWRSQGLRQRHFNPLPLKGTLPVFQLSCRMMLNSLR